MTRRTNLLAIALVVLFAFRLAFGLCDQLFTEDETQIYLLGLRAYATHHWPFFGPDVVWTQSQIPGALQALLVAVPLAVAWIPEAPYVFLNLLSMGSLCLFAGYLCRRLPQLPRWLVWGWLLTLPWTLELSTHIINPSYVLPASLLFFLAFFEAWPPLATGRLSTPLAHALMGAALGWVAQVHMSWPLLLPFAGLAFLARLRDGSRAVIVAAGAFALGAGVTGSLLLPTFVKYGLLSGAGSTERNAVLNWRNPAATFGTTSARFLSFASYEVNRFVADGTPKRVVFLAEHWWLVPVVAVAWLAGLVHPVWMALTAFRRQSPVAHWAAVRWTAVATAALVTVSFYFVMEPAQARSFYVVAPVALLYAAYCWTFIDSRRWRRVAAVVLAANVVLQASLALTRLRGPSLYMNRPLVSAAIQRAQPGLFSHRRPYARDATPDAVAASVIGANAAGDLEVAQAAVSPAFGGWASWTMDIRNRSTHVAYRDLQCETRYYDASGQIIERRVEPVWLVLEPGEVRQVRVIDGAKWTTARAEARILTAEPLEPLEIVAGPR